MTRPVGLQRIVLFTLLLGSNEYLAPALVFAQAPPIAKSEDNAVRAEKPAAVAWRDLEFQVLTARGEAVAGAKVTPWQVAYRTGSMGVGEKLSAERTTDADGRFRFTILEDDPLAARLKEAGGFRSVAFSIDHPNHPQWSDYVPIEEERDLQIVDPVGGVINAKAKVEEAKKIVLPDAATVRVRVRSNSGNSIPGDLYPSPASLDWSAADGLVMLRRVDLTSRGSMRWLRVVSAPADGPAMFTDLVDLKLHRDPISLELPLQPGTRVMGQLSPNVPRPVKEGRAIAHIVVGDQAGGRGWWWSAAVPVTPEGTFEFPSLPRESNLQLLVRCDGWLSASPTKQEVEAYGTAHGFATGPRDDTMMRATQRAYPQLYRLAGESLDFEIAMEPTLACEIKVVDEQDRPLPGIRVGFSPNQYWFEGGSQLLGAEADSLAALRADATKKQSRFAMPGNPFYGKETNDQGFALITNLPACGPGGPNVARSFYYNVSAENYELTPGAPLVGQAPFRYLNVTIQPGKTAQATIRMKRK